ESEPAKQNSDPGERRGNSRRARDASQALHDILEHLAIALRARRTGGMCAVAREPAAQMQELGGAVLVRGHRGVEGEEAKILQQVVQLEKPRIALLPVAIAKREFFR